MSKRLRNTVILVFLFLAGLSLMLYPTFSDWWNAQVQSRVVASYAEAINQMDEERKNQLWREAEEFNEALKLRADQFALPSYLETRYRDTLDVSGTGVMGYVEIPSIDVLLPVYHTTQESVLQTSIGHIEWTYLPIGGEGTHSCISGHRGLPSARLFTDLGKLVVGDVFMLQILDRTLTYEIDQILIVEPGDITALAPVPGEDYCTMETCTPYGVNTHRMLVRGHRIDNIRGTVRLVSEAMLIEPLIVAPVIGIPLLLLLLVVISVQDIRKNKRRKRNKLLNISNT